MFTQYWYHHEHHQIHCFDHIHDHQVPNLLLRLSATNFSAPALLINCHFDRCRLHNDENYVDEDEEDDGDVDDEEDVDADGEDGYDDAQRGARSRRQRQHAQLCNHARGQTLKHHDCTHNSTTPILEHHDCTHP